MPNARVVPYTSFCVQSLLLYQDWAIFCIISMMPEPCSTHQYLYARWSTFSDRFHNVSFTMQLHDQNTTLSFNTPQNERNKTPSFAVIPTSLGSRVHRPLGLPPLRPGPGGTSLPLVDPRSYCWRSYSRWTTSSPPRLCPGRWTRRRGRWSVGSRFCSCRPMVATWRRFRKDIELSVEIPYLQTTQKCMMIHSNLL